MLVGTRHRCPVLAAACLWAVAGCGRHATPPPPPPAPAPVVAAPVPPPSPTPPDVTPAAGAGSVPILCYHRVADAPALDTVVTTGNFEQQMTWLRDNGYSVIPLAQLVEALEKHTPLPAKAVVLTFDDGFRTDYDNVFPVLKRFGYPATLFIYTIWVGAASGADTWDGLRQMLASGLIDVQSHTVTHANLSQVSNRAGGGERLARELTLSKSTLESKLGQPVTILAYPYGACDQTVEAAVKAAGYHCALTVNGDCAGPGDDLLRLGRRMVFHKDTLQTFAALRVGLERLAATDLQPPDGSAVSQTQPTIGALLPGQAAIDTLSLRLDGVALKRTFDHASRRLSAQPAKPLAAGRHRVELSVSAGGQQLHKSWAFRVEPGG
jgi:peptidoglycan/xylan/chitin deacetylase (PgdA/CDA1 family)